MASHVTLEEREVLYKKLHHRVKNNLQLLSSMIDMQVMRASDHVPVEKLQELQSIINTMALIYSRSFEGTDSMSLNLKMFITELTSGLLKFKDDANQDIQFIVDGEDIFLATDKAIPVVLIANELIFNSLKHAFSGLNKGKITIQLYRENNDLKLSFNDDGKGLPEGFDINRINTLGLKLVRNLIEQLNGTLTINNNSGTGTEFVISIPVE